MSTLTTTAIIRIAGAALGALSLAATVGIANAATHDAPVMPQDVQVVAMDDAAAASMYNG